MINPASGNPTALAANVASQTARAQTAPPPAQKTAWVAAQQESTPQSLAEKSAAANAAEALARSVAELQRRAEEQRPNTLQFSIDEESGRTIVKITDAQTGETIRQIPPEEALALARAIDRWQGLLLQQKA